MRAVEILWNKKGTKKECKQNDMCEWYGYLGCEDDKNHGGESVVVSNYCKWTQAVKKGVATFKPTWIEGLKIDWLADNTDVAL